MASNPVSVPLPANAQIEVTAISNASNWQKATVHIDDTPVPVTAVFLGQGENTPMRLPNSDDSIVVKPAPYARNCTITFQYSLTQTGPFDFALVKNPIIIMNGPFTIITIDSEDSTDDDNNDTYITIVCINVTFQADQIEEFAAGSSVTSSTVRCTKITPSLVQSLDNVTENKTSISSASNTLNLHAKTYYTGPPPSNLPVGGFEHYVDIDISSDNPTAKAYSVGFQVSKAVAWIDRTSSPIFNYVLVTATFSGCAQAGMEKAVLTLSSYFTFLISPPTGAKSADWIGSLQGTDFSLTRLTN